jgi:starch synthase
VVNKKAKPKTKVLFVSAEVAPFSSVGGLSQVAYFLPRALFKKGLDLRIFTPKYGTISEKKFALRTVVENLEVPTGEGPNSPYPTKLICNVKTLAETKKSEPIIYFLENMEYFEKRANVYGYSDDHIRFALMSQGALQFVKTGYFIPEIIHGNDWHSGYLIDYLRQKYANCPKFKKIATIFSIHNLYQGNFDFKHASEMDFDDGKSQLAPFYSERFFKQNSLKRGIIYADLVNTVSETYAREMQTEEYGNGLHLLFKELRGKLYGVLNGLDYADFNPATDKIIKKNYSLANLSDRRENKIDLQKQFNLKIDPNIPILAFEGRLDEQKGLELIMETIDFLLSELEVQFVILGIGDNKYREFFDDLEKRYPEKVGTHLIRDFVLPRKIFAGADIILLPSKYEPGGIIAMEALRYGCIPVVRATGGLSDIVADFDTQKISGTGFTFKKFTREGFLVAVVRALETYKNKAVWQKIMREGMRQDFSWNKVAEKYANLYQRATKFRKESLSPNPPSAFRQMAV